MVCTELNLKWCAELHVADVVVDTWFVFVAACNWSRKRSSWYRVCIQHQSELHDAVRLAVSFSRCFSAYFVSQCIHEIEIRSAIRKFHSILVFLSINVNFSFLYFLFLHCTFCMYDWYSPNSTRLVTSRHTRHVWRVEFDTFDVSSESRRVCRAVLVPTWWTANKL